MPNDLSVWSMVLDASPIVQAVVFLLLFASVASWAIIFRKSRVISQSRRGADQFEAQFWSGGDLAALYRGIETKGRAGTGLESIFESGFGEFSRLRQLGTAADLLLEGARRSMRVAQMRELDRLERNLALDEPLRRIVRHRVGNHVGIPQSRQRAAGDAGRRRARDRRGVDHHGGGPVCGHSRRGRLQSVRRPGQPIGTSIRHLCRRVLNDSAAARVGPCGVFLIPCRHRCVVAN